MLCVKCHPAPPTGILHYKEDSIYVCPEIKLRGLSPNFYIQIYASDLYIPTIGPPIFLQQNRQIDYGNFLLEPQTLVVHVDNIKTL